MSATIKLDRWMEAPFYLTDKDLMEANRGVIPMQASEAVKAIANDVNATLLGLGRKFYGIVGTPGTTPFSTVVDATNARKVLNRQLAPVNDRRIVLDPDAEAAALGLSGFADVSKSGDTRPIIDGTIGRKYGFDWAMDQQVPTFEASVMTEGALTVNGANEAGTQVVSLAKATNAASLKEGDILTIAGDGQTYVVTEAVSLAVGNTAVKIYPGLARGHHGSGSRHGIRFPCDEPRLPPRRHRLRHPPADGFRQRPRQPHPVRRGPGFRPVAPPGSLPRAQAHPVQL